jgi:hypothetical protein
MTQRGSAEPLHAGESIASGHPIKGAACGVVQPRPGGPLDRGSASGKALPRKKQFKSQSVQLLADWQRAPARIIGMPPIACDTRGNAREGSHLHFSGRLCLVDELWSATQPVWSPNVSSHRGDRHPSHGGKPSSNFATRGHVCLQRHNRLDRLDALLRRSGCSEAQPAVADRAVFWMGHLWLGHHVRSALSPVGRHHRCGPAAQHGLGLDAGSRWPNSHRDWFGTGSVSPGQSAVLASWRCCDLRSPDCELANRQAGGSVFDDQMGSFSMHTLLSTCPRWVCFRCTSGLVLD